MGVLLGDPHIFWTKKEDAEFFDRGATGLPLANLYVECFALWKQ